VPLMTDPFACTVIGCHYLTAGDLERCEKAHCPYSHQRRREEDRLRQQANEMHTSHIFRGPNEQSKRR
jgi:hypothetical protein